MEVTEPTVLLGAKQVINGGEEDEVCYYVENSDDGMDPEYEAFPEEETCTDSLRNTRRRRGVKRQRAFLRGTAHQKLSAQTQSTGRPRVRLSGLF